MRLAVPPVVLCPLAASCACMGYPPAFRARLPCGALPFHCRWRGQLRLQRGWQGVTGAHALLLSVLHRVHWCHCGCCCCCFPILAEAVAAGCLLLLLLLLFLGVWTAGEECTHTHTHGASFASQVETKPPDGCEFKKF